MEQQHPFKQEEGETIRWITKYTINGFKIKKDLTSFEWKIKTLVDVFLSTCGAEKADMWHLPYDGGALDQPHKTMRVWMMMKSLLGEHISKENEKRMKEMKAKSRRH